MTNISRCITASLRIGSLQGGDLGSMGAVLALLTSLLFTGSLFGQTEVPSNASSVVRGMPYTATQRRVTKVRLPDGTYKVTTRKLVLTRSSDGVVRREVYEPLDGEIAKGKPAIASVVILDEEKNATIILSPQTRTATIGAHPAAKAPGGQRPPAPQRSSLGGASVTRLANESIAGLSAPGRRNSYTLPDPTGKNSGAVTVTTDTWYSSDLHLVLKSETRDSQGNSDITITTEIKREEPDASVFKIPEGFTTKSFVKAQ